MRNETVLRSGDVPPGLIDSLRRKHHELDELVMAEQKAPLPDTLLLRRLKSEKLAVKDRLAALGVH
ncbi:MAG TPA: YdcH family protein [Paracoccaceae bacterium]|nr:YdcH family protein [Paracoccaceae bacterium]